MYNIHSPCVLYSDANPLRNTAPPRRTRRIINVDYHHMCDYVAATRAHDAAYTVFISGVARVPFLRRSICRTRVLFLRRESATARDRRERSRRKVQCSDHVITADAYGLDETAGALAGPLWSVSPRERFGNVFFTRLETVDVIFFSLSVTPFGTRRKILHSRKA